MTPQWEHFEHQADIGVRGIGRTPAEAFEQAAMAMVAAMVDLDRIVPVERVDVVCQGPDLELLLVDWLNAVLYQMSARRMVFGRFEVRIDAVGLSAWAWGERLDPARHEPCVEVKAATYLALRVGAGPDGAWTAQCVVDV